MIDWHADPLWCLFAAAGIDPATMRPLPMCGPPRPAPAVDEEQRRRLWRLEKQLNRAWRYLDKAERRGSWADLNKSQRLAAEAFDRRYT